LTNQNLGPFLGEPEMSQGFQIRNWPKEETLNIEERSNIYHSPRPFYDLGKGDLHPRVGNIERL